MSEPQQTNADVKPLRKGWEWVPLGKYVENHDGRRIPIAKKERESRSGSFPYYGASGVIDTIDGFTHDGEFLLIGEDGANLLTRSKPLAFLTRGKVWVNNHAHVLRCKPGYSNAYLAYFINSIDLSQYVTGTAQPKLSQSMMNKILIPVAPPEQQVEIVAELEKQFSRLDEAVANLKRVKANLKRYKASVLKDAVEGRLVPTEAELARREGRSFETGAQLLQRILETRRSRWTGRGKYKEPCVAGETELLELPAGWAFSNGGQLFQWSSGVNLPVKNLMGGAVPVYGGNGVNGWHTDSNVSSPTLVIGRVGAGCGNVHFVDGVAWITDNAIYASWVPCGCNLAYLGLVLTVANLNSVAAGSGQPFVNQTILNDTLIPLPPTVEQNRIVAEVERHLSIIREVEAEVDVNLQRALALRQAILAKSFTRN